MGFCVVDLLICPAPSAATGRVVTQAQIVEFSGELFRCEFNGGRLVLVTDLNH
jgi:hypothetical protein